MTTLERLRSLRSSPRALWVVLVLKFLESFADFATSLNLTLYLSAQFGYSDVAAGTLYSAWGLSVGVFGLLLGPFIDQLGVRNALLVGGCLNALGRALFVFGSHRAQAIVALLVLQGAGMSLAIPVLTIAIRRTTTTDTRSIAFGVFYTVMNVAALCGAVATEALGSHFHNRCDDDGGGENTGVCAMRALFCISTATTIVYVVIVCTAFESAATAPTQRLFKQHDSVKSFASRARDVYRDAVFWRLVAFTAALFSVHAVFRHMDTTLPKYMRRTLGSDAHYARVWAINPTIVILATTPAQTLLAHYSSYNVIAYGTVITAMAPFVLFAFDASYGSAVLFAVIVSLGEIVHSPRHMEYSMQLAPPGQEGLYGSLAVAPLFVVRLVSGSLGGVLLERYCAATATPSERHCGTMWLIVGVQALSTPLLLIVGRRFFHSAAVRARIAERRPSSPSSMNADTIELTDE